MTKKEVSGLQERFGASKPEEILAYFLSLYRGRIALASSLSAEDQALTDMVLNIDPEAKAFTLDTGRLHQETYNTIQETMNLYGMRYEVYFPERREIEEMEGTFGPNLFYDSVERRILCCEARKVKPLKRALKGLEAWVTGLRREHSAGRAGLQKVEWDSGNRLLKLNPICDWSGSEVWEYIRARGVPYNRLHDLRYPSIGCSCCTRAVAEGEDMRGGRWWWEQSGKKECGLHLDGRRL